MRKQWQARSVGKTIKGAREQQGMTQQELANQIGVSLGTVSRWERGLHLERSYVRNLRRLAEALSLDIAELRALQDAGLDDRLMLLEARVDAIMRWIVSQGGEVPLDGEIASLLEANLRDPSTGGRRGRAVGPRRVARQ